LVVAQSSSEIPEGLTNNPVFSGEQRRQVVEWRLTRRSAEHPLELCIKEVTTSDVCQRRFIPARTLGTKLVTRQERW